MAPLNCGKYFFLKNRHNKLYLENTFSPNGKNEFANDPTKSPVSLWKKISSDENFESQLWFQDPLTETVRHKMTNKCISITVDNRICLEVFKTNVRNDEHGEPETSARNNATNVQKWYYNKERQVIESCTNPSKVLDVVHHSKDEGAELCVADFNGRRSQIWRLKSAEINYFYVKSVSERKVLDVLGGRTKAGSMVGLYAQKTTASVKTQLFFEDYERNIRSKMNKRLVLNVSDTGTTLAKPNPNSDNQYWLISGNKIVKAGDSDIVMTAIKLTHPAFQDGRLDEHRAISSRYEGSESQHWVIIYYQPPTNILI
ncbi:hypothetical protein HELRODRAFT_168715 [Helobdella robusta]|uniref:Ricin B lectin domain-containing protein n=1 Tax=Helobdella robusta TaxID=6412 RepID=T1F0W0_HELRO|nr:hypothetical protein HELRODRAFT_168715 [Helobdella robusta]ESO08807.1 hypothetical protein HELRODRAFT_168715 [Helobdella robusta]